MSPQLAVARHLMLLDSGSPGRADTFPFLPVSTIVLCQQQAPGWCLLVPALFHLAGHNIITFFSNSPRIADVPSPPIPSSSPVCSN